MALPDRPHDLPLDGPFIAIARKSTTSNIPVCCLKHAHEVLALDLLSKRKWRSAMAQHVKHMTDNYCATEGGRAFSWRIDIRLRPRSAVMPPYSMTMVAIESLVEGTTTNLVMRYHTMPAVISPSAIQFWTFVMDRRWLIVGANICITTLTDVTQ